MGAASDQRPCTCWPTSERCARMRRAAKRERRDTAGLVALAVERPEAARGERSPRASVRCGARSGAHASLVASPAHTRSHSASRSASAGASSSASRSLKKQGPWAQAGAQEVVPRPGRRRQRALAAGRGGIARGVGARSARWRADRGGVLAEVESNTARASERTCAHPHDLAARAQRRPATSASTRPCGGATRRAPRSGRAARGPAAAPAPRAGGRLRRPRALAVHALPRRQERRQARAVRRPRSPCAGPPATRGVGGAGPPRRTTRGRGAGRAAARRAPVRHSRSSSRSTAPTSTP